MHAVGYRPRWSLLVALLAALIALGAFVRLPTGSRCKRIKPPVADSRALADRMYRAHRFDDAARILQLAGDMEAVKQREELYVVAGFYRQLGVSYARSRDEAPSTRTLHVIDQAIRLDDMLGGAHARELDRRRHRVISAVGPE